MPTKRARSDRPRERSFFGSPHFNPAFKTQIDSSLRLVLTLIQRKDFFEIALRTGVKEDTGNPNATYQLPVMVELGEGLFPTIESTFITTYNVPLAYTYELDTNKKLRFVTARIRLDPEIFQGKTQKLEDALTNMLKRGAKRVSLGVPGQPSLAAAMGDIEIPIDRKYKNKVLTGDGVVVGIIDDGAALAHWNFIQQQGNGPLASRIQYIWDQAGNGNPAAGWALPVDPGTGQVDFDGLELTNPKINAALNLFSPNQRTIAEEKFYGYLGYLGYPKVPIDLASHGTHVMDVAAGNGQSLMESEQGVAPGADIIFVQLRAVDIQSGALALWPHIYDGLMYIFSRARALGKKPAVVNISYGGYDGPHDGTADLERAMDTLLALPDRAVVLAGGNGFEASCHAAVDVPANSTSQPLRWITLPEDPTPNELWAWYDGASSIEVRITGPDNLVGQPGWIPFGSDAELKRQADSYVVGNIENMFGGTPNMDHKIVISLRATDPSAEDTTTKNGAAPPGIWTVEFRNTGPNDVTVHAWILLDDAGHPSEARRRQSRFHEDDSSPDYTISGWGTGFQTISVGAFNTGTQEVSRYSACGPTRPTGKKKPRKKPDLLAPAEEDVRRQGVLCASSREANPTRMNGTSISAPFVTGAVALLFEYSTKYGGGGLGADQIRKYLKLGASAGSLLENRHQRVDVHVPIKQLDVWSDLVGAGKLDFLNTISKLFP